jgi:hypothetical protein
MQSMNLDGSIVKKQIPDELIAGKIFQIRTQKVMLDMDLAQLYNVETKQLKRAVRRSISRFPLDLMFELSKDEFSNLRCQNGTSSWGGSRYLPLAFTEYGVLMLSSVLNSERAIQVNIQIIRLFTKIKELLSGNSEMLQKLQQLERNDIDHDDKILRIFDYLKQLEQNNKEQEEFRKRPRIGFKS